MLKPLLFGTAASGLDVSNLTNDISAILCFVSSRASAEASIVLLNLLLDGLMVWLPVVLFVCFRQCVLSTRIRFPRSGSRMSFSLQLKLQVVRTPSSPAWSHRRSHCVWRACVYWPS